MELKRKSKKNTDAPEATNKRMQVKLGKGKKQHFTLFVGDDGAILVYAEGMTVVRRLFAPSPAPEHTKAMIDLLSQHPKAPVRMLMDVMDQQYLRETFPPVSSLSVGSLATRRMNRDFAPEDMRGAINMGREATARKDWIYLLVSLSNTALFKQWFELVAEQPNRFLGVHLVPLESETILPAIATAMADTVKEVPAWQLLVSCNKVSGFRIVVLRKGRLAFSRVGQGVGDDSPSVVAGNIEQEIQNTIEYIRRLGYSETDGLAVFVIAAAEVRDAIDAKRINARSLNLLSPFDVAELLRLKQAALAADRFGDVVIATAFALSTKQRLTLKPVYAKKLEQMFIGRMATRAVAGLAVLALLWSIISSVVSGLSDGSTAQEAEQKAKQEAASVGTFRKQVEELGKDANKKSDIATFYNATALDKHLPLSVLDTLSVLQRDNVTVKEWEWLKTDAAAQAASDGKSYPVAVQATVELTGAFPDEQTVLEAIAAYKLYLSQSIKTYAVDIPNASVSGSGKVSVAVQTDTQKTAEIQQAPSLTVTLRGPLETPPAQNNPAGATP